MPPVRRRRDDIYCLLARKSRLCIVMSSPQQRWWHGRTQTRMMHQGMDAHGMVAWKEEARDARQGSPGQGLSHRLTGDRRRSCAGGVGPHFCSRSMETWRTPAGARSRSGRCLCHMDTPGGTSCCASVGSWKMGAWKMEGWARLALRPLALWFEGRRPSLAARSPVCWVGMWLRVIVLVDV